jgi:drug/metabolite transporter (DMT)-like permease
MLSRDSAACRGKNGTVSSYLPLARLHSTIPASWVFAVFALSLATLFAVWRWLDQRGHRRRRTIPLFLVGTLVWLVIYPKLMVRG